MIWYILILVAYWAVGTCVGVWDLDRFRTNVLHAKSRATYGDIAFAATICWMLWPIILLMNTVDISLNGLWDRSPFGKKDRP